MQTWMKDSRPRARTRAALLRHQRGAAVVQYLLVVGGVAMIALSGFKLFGKSVNDVASCYGEDYVAKLPGSTAPGFGAVGVANGCHAKYTRGGWGPFHRAR